LLTFGFADRREDQGESSSQGLEARRRGRLSRGRSRRIEYGTSSR
jgi:hypothetical protein